MSFDFRYICFWMKQDETCVVTSSQDGMDPSSWPRSLVAFVDAETTKRTGSSPCITASAVFSRYILRHFMGIMPRISEGYKWWICY